jgi:CRP/FNR family transcriptional regulator
VETFTGLTEEELQVLAVEAQHRIYGRHESVACPGEGERWAYLVLEGRARLHRYSDDHKRATLLELRRGDLLERVIPGFYLDAAGRGEVICRISRRQLTQARQSNPELHRRLERMRDGLIAELAELSFELMVLGVETRVERLLLRHRERVGARLRLTRDEVAEFVGASRQAVTQALGALVARGVIQFDPHHPSRIDVYATPDGE